MPVDAGMRVSSDVLLAPAPRGLRSSFGPRAAVALLDLGVPPVDRAPLRTWVTPSPEGVRSDAEIALLVRGREADLLGAHRGVPAVAPLPDGVLRSAILRHDPVLVTGYVDEVLEAHGAPAVVLDVARDATTDRAYVTVAVILPGPSAVPAVRVELGTDDVRLVPRTGAERDRVFGQAAAAVAIAVGKLVLSAAESADEVRLAVVRPDASGVAVLYAGRLPADLLRTEHPDPLAAVTGVAGSRWDLTDGRLVPLDPQTHPDLGVLAEDLGRVLVPARVVAVPAVRRDLWPSVWLWVAAAACVLALVVGRIDDPPAAAPSGHPAVTAVLPG